MDPKDPAFSSSAWKTALRHYKHRRHKAANKAFTKVDTKLRQEVSTLFHPDAEGNTAKSEAIQKWLQRHVHTRNPGVMIHRDRFTYPAIVWWAWADTACRAEDYTGARVALTRLEQIRPGGDLLHHKLLLMLRLKQAKRAAKLLPKAPPDAFLTPYLEALVARANGDETRARAKLREAGKAAMLRDRQAAVKRELAWEEEEPTAPEGR